MITVRIPRDTAVATKFFAQFTAKDIVRIAAPVLAVIVASPASTTSQVGGLASAAAVSSVWYLWRPYGNPVDTHLINAVMWYLRRSTVNGRDIQQWSINTGDVVTSSDYVVGFIEVDPTNLSLRTENEQAALHTIYQEMLETVSYPIKVHSRQEPATAHIEYGKEIADNRVKPEDLQDSYLDLWKQISDTQPITTRHFISIRVPLATETTSTVAQLLGHSDTGFSLDMAPTEVDRRCREVITSLQSADLDADRVTGDWLKDVATLFEDDDPKVSSAYTRTEHQVTDMGKNDSGKRDAWRKSIVLTDFPSSMRLGWTTELLAARGRVEVTQVIRPEDPASTTKKLTSTVEKISAEINSWLNSGYLGTNDLEAKYDDVNWMLDRFVDREDKPFSYACYVTVTGGTEHRCEQNMKRVKKTLDTMQIGYTEPVLETHNAYKAVSPFYPDPFTDRYVMPGSSVASGFPFSTQVPQNTSGVLYGEEPATMQPVVLDRFEWSSHSMARMGMVGSGKSFAAKLDLLRSWVAYEDLQVIVVDPKQEYGEVVRTIGHDSGRVDTIQTGKSYRFDHDTLCFHLPKRGASDDADRLVELVEQIYAATSQDQRKTVVLIDEARILLNDEEGRQVLNRFVLEARDTNTSVTLITQNASHFTHSREGREILDNMPAKFFMRHDRVPDSVVDYFDLSDREKQELYKLKTGTESPYSECLVQVSDRVDTTALIRATEMENDIIESGEDNDNTGDRQ